MANWKDHCIYFNKPMYEPAPIGNCSMRHGQSYSLQRNEELKKLAIQESENKYWNTRPASDSAAGRALTRRHSHEIAQAYDTHMSTQTGISLPLEVLKKIEEYVKKGGNPYGKMRKKTSKNKRKSKKKKTKRKKRTKQKKTKRRSRKKK